jgi:hypothetical protein
MKWLGDITEKYGGDGDPENRKSRTQSYFIGGPFDGHLYEVPRRRPDKPLWLQPPIYGEDGRPIMRFGFNTAYNWEQMEILEYVMIRRPRRGRGARYQFRKKLVMKRCGAISDNLERCSLNSWSPASDYCTVHHRRYLKLGLIHEKYGKCVDCGSTTFITRNNEVPENRQTRIACLNPDCPNLGPACPNCEASGHYLPDDSGKGFMVCRMCNHRWEVLAAPAPKPVV